MVGRWLLARFISLWGERFATEHAALSHSEWSKMCGLGLSFNMESVCRCIVSLTDQNTTYFVQKMKQQTNRDLIKTAWCTTYTHFASFHICADHLPVVVHSEQDLVRAVACSLKANCAHGEVESEPAGCTTSSQRLPCSAHMHPNHA